MGGRKEIKIIGGEQGLDYFRNIARIEYGTETIFDQNEFLDTSGATFANLADVLAPLMTSGTKLDLTVILVNDMHAQYGMFCE